MLSSMYTLILLYHIVSYFYFGNIGKVLNLVQLKTGQFIFADFLIVSCLHKICLSVCLSVCLFVCDCSSYLVESCNLVFSTDVHCAISAFVNSQQVKEVIANGHDKFYFKFGELSLS